MIHHFRAHRDVLVRLLASKLFPGCVARYSVLLLGGCGGCTRAILSIDADHRHSVVRERDSSIPRVFTASSLTVYHYFDIIASAIDLLFEGSMKLFGHLGSFDVKILLLGHHLLLLLRLGLLGLAEGRLWLGLW